MTYFYDVLVNLDECCWEFYEWENSDHLQPIKKVPIVRVSLNDFKKLSSYQIKFDGTWIESFKRKTILKNSKEKPTFILFSSTKNALLLEVNDEGMSIYRSKLLVEDEINCNEMAYALKETILPYQLGELLPFKKEFRRAKEEKRVLKAELKTIQENHNLEKISYLYFEWFGSLEKDLSLMLKKMNEELAKPYSLKIHQIVELIKLSYREQL